MKNSRVVLPLLHPSGRHLVGVVVPHGGSSCARCRFGYRLTARLRTFACQLAVWVRAKRKDGGGGGNPILPVRDPRDFCCDGFEPAEGVRLARPTRRIS